MAEEYTLLLKLEGPMQSWGFRSRFDYRDTSLEPTRSGIIGLLCAAMGIARGESISRFDALRMGVRVEKEGRPERDYHTALDVIKADGSTPGTVVSHRDYLADASFLVGLESKDLPLLEEITLALKSPCWLLFLGRKAFPLACPPLLPEARPEKGSLEDFLFTGEQGCRIILETEDGAHSQHDWPLCFGERRFMPRKFTITFDGKGDPE
jgi:CRISPR system Cascade subunit CasD